VALLEWGSRRFAIPAGEVTVGSDSACAIQVSEPQVLARHAVLASQPDGQVAIRRAVPEADIVINGVRQGGEPTPLLHGDKVELGGVELTFVDERRSGSTQYIQALQVPQAAARAKADARSGMPTGNTGGRVVSLTDGREYAVTGASLVFGREAGCDVVVTGKDVSRRHAEIMATPKGYLLVDSSTNGTFVNEERLQGQRILMRADVIRVGEETFRFYADPAPQPAGAPPPPPPPPAGAPERLQDTAFGIPSVKRGESSIPTGRPSEAGPMASFLVRNGALKGQRLIVRTPVANIGRAEYNDLVVPEESVSTAHAKLQRREGVWVLSDLGSTNGTFVDGERVKDDTPIAPSAVVRLGDVSMVFEPTDDALGVASGSGTKVIQAMQPPPAAPAPPPPAPAAPAPPKRATPPRPAPPSRSAAPAKPAAPSARPQPRRPAGQAPEKAKAKGCGSSAAIVVLGLAAALTWILR
jgi:pSer/pThr/pTyr-binding forkhead associated (FHA) protein